MSVLRMALQSLVFASVGVLLLGLASADSCLDAGGVVAGHWFACDTGGDDFVPQYFRPTPLFWLVLVALSYASSWLAVRLASKLSVSLSDRLRAWR
jgi:hypothetical protein